MTIRKADQRTLLRAADALAADKRLNADEVALVVSLGTRGGQLGAAERAQLHQVLHRHKDALTPDARRSLEAFLGTAIRADRGLTDLAARLGVDGSLDRADVGRLLDRTRADGKVTREERRALEGLVDDPKVAPGARQLIRGFLLTLPGDTDALPAAQPARSSGTQVVALRANAKRHEGTLAIDPDKTPVSLQRIKDLVGETAAEGHLLAAMGAASQEQRADLQAGKLTLREFYGLAAKGHFGEAVDKPVTYVAFRETLLQAGLEHDFKRIFDQLPQSILERAKSGELTPRELMNHQADIRSRWTAGTSPQAQTTLVRELAKEGRLDELAAARKLMSSQEVAALESGKLSPAALDLLLADATSRDVDVVIIGGGMAGLAAARDLMAE
ncbi:MAG: hypothetical protein ACO3JL_14830, partial [Myxococcota bacterium]